MPKVTLQAERLYIIRSTKTKPTGEVDVRYYETVSVWNASPMEATIFQNFEAGEAHMQAMERANWADGSTEVVDVVPFYGEILQSPNARIIKRKRPRQAR